MAKLRIAAPAWSWRDGRGALIRPLRLIALLAAVPFVLGASGPTRGADGRGVLARLPAAAEQARAPAQAVRPAPPRPYEVARPYVRVRNVGQLRAALARRAPTRILLRAGRYESDRPFLNAYGHALLAETVGKAVLTGGLSVGEEGGAPGGLVRGLVFDLRDPAATVDGIGIAVRNAGARLLDVALYGHGVVRSGIVVRQPEGFRAERLVVRDFTDYGVLVDMNDRSRTTLARPFALRDLDVAGIRRAVPGSSRGRGEACIWIGNPGRVERARVRRCAWTGLWTGTAATRAYVTQVDVDETRTGVYVEHFTHATTFDRIRIGRRVRVGLTAEWADPDWGGLPASVDNVVQNSRFESWLVGVYLDKGTTRTTVRWSTFVGQRWAAIGDYQGVGNAYYGNDYRRLAPGAAAVTHEHIRNAAGVGG